MSEDWKVVPSVMVMTADFSSAERLADANTFFETETVHFWAGNCPLTRTTLSVLADW
ncbi:MAG: hypothetical protein IJ852_01430 [Alphaproteobacteria bacterium]|nr:hypothetical protein [Alphaproteobacteria bacterium]